MIILYYHSDELKLIVDVIKDDFWPSNVSNKKRLSELKYQTKLVNICIYMICTSAFIFAYGFLSAPLLQGNMVLPFESWYPFNWQSFPFYEIIYVSQWIINIYVVIITICGHDFVFLATINNCIAQFQLLGDVLRKIGDDDRPYLLRKNKERFSGRKYEDINEELLVLCVKHHKRLIMFAYFKFDCIF